jgi:putative redox protein
MIVVETFNAGGRSTAVGRAGAFSLIVDRPTDVGGGGLGFSGGQLFREARARGIHLDSVRVEVAGDFAGDPAVSSPVTYRIELGGDATAAELEALAHEVDRIAEIPNSLRGATAVRLDGVLVTAASPR